MYPKPLSKREREWIEWILPPDRPAYKTYRDMIQSMMIIGEGRRGAGEIILGREGQSVDLTAPLAPVLAYGAIETNAGTVSITLREVVDDQISVEMVHSRSDEMPAAFEEIRRWTYSTWSPGNVCPQCNSTVREVSMHTMSGSKEYFALAICRKDRRLWVYSESDKINRLIPVTNYYNELMLHKNIRDPRIALDSKRLFVDLDNFSDADLTYAFLTYNKLKTKVRIEGTVTADRNEHPTLLQKIQRVFSKRVS